MPLKHHTETAYLVFLGLVICLAGFIASLLPELPEGLKYCVLSFTLAALYPIVLMPTFKRNRVDYEFRLLHWFPAGIFVLWVLLQLSDPYWEWFHILKLGFLFLWGLPIVILGLSFIMMFSIHVLRRRNVRVTVLSVFLLLFTVGAVMAESNGWNESLQANLFTGKHLNALRPMASRMMALSKLIRSTQSSSSVTSTKKSTSSAVSLQPFVPMMQETRASSIRSSLIADHMPSRLPKSGPESAAVLFVTLVALYFGTLHTRSKKRV